MEVKKKFSMTLAQPEILRDSIKVLSGLITEARLNISKDGLKITELDPANVSMAIWHLLPSACVEYEIQEPLIIGINLNSMLAILKNAKKSDMLNLSLDADSENVGDKLSISLKGSITRNYTLPLIDLSDITETKIPNLKFKAKVKMSSDTFADSIKEADTIAESVVFEAIETDKTFILSAERDLNKLNIPFRENENTKIEVSAKAKYNIEYLKKMAVAKCLSGEVTLEFGTDYPLRLTYKQVDKLMISFVLAPRIDS